MKTFFKGAAIGLVAGAAAAAFTLPLDSRAIKRSAPGKAMRRAAGAFERAADTVADIFD